MRALRAQRNRECAADRAPILDRDERARLVTLEVVAHMLAGIAGVDDHHAVRRQHFANRVRHELRLDRKRIGLHDRGAFAVVPVAGLGDIDPCLAQSRLGRACAQPRNHARRRSGDGNIDRKDDADVPRG